MKQLIICPEFPPVPISGGIGTYVLRISQLLAESGDTVHVIAWRWGGARRRIEERCGGRLVIHRVGDGTPLPELSGADIGGAHDLSVRGMLRSAFPPQAFSYQACLLAERLIEREGIDLIEGQEFEAPLYYLQLRRALGMGPDTQPPCLVHLHSPMECIVRYNDWNIHHPYFRTARRLEGLSIRAADAHLCPSRSLAATAEARYGLPENGIRVIPLPLPASPDAAPRRIRDAWTRGPILHLGRLERRKGVIEWIEAAVRAASEDPGVRFEFVGANCLGTDKESGSEVIETLIPRQLRSRFVFRGEKRPADIRRFLAAARFAAIPSRWENFPNTCMEAMASGLPVLATREGGLVEMIEDGRTGWLTEEPGPEGLLRALERALATPADRMAEMGREASAAIRDKCNAEKILAEHIAFRNEVRTRGAARSLSLPKHLAWTSRSPKPGTRLRPRAEDPAARGMAVVVSSRGPEPDFCACLEGIRSQTRKPAAVVIVHPDSGRNRSLEAVAEVSAGQWCVLSPVEGREAHPNNTAVDHIRDSGVNPLAVCFLTDEDRLQPRFVEICESVLTRCPEVGILSGWVDFETGSTRLSAPPCPAFPYQWVSNEIAPFSAVRTKALVAAGAFRSLGDRDHEMWDMFNAVLAAGWVGVTFPAILGHSLRPANLRAGNWLNVTGKARQDILARFPEALARHAMEIVLLAEADAAFMLERRSDPLSAMIPDAVRMVGTGIGRAAASLRLFRRSRRGS